jgi:hypothetical protein
MAGNTSLWNYLLKKMFIILLTCIKSLEKNQRVKITCDILGIDGYLQGTAPIR